MEENTLFGVWGSSSDNVYAVGNIGALLHYGGSYWSPVIKGKFHASFQDVDGASASDIIAVGGSTIIRYDGDSWSRMQEDTNAWLTDVWNSATYGKWVVGHDGTVLEYDGTLWDSKGGFPSNVNLNGVWAGTTAEMSSTSMSQTGMMKPAQSADPTDNVYMVGNGGTIWHYDGHDFTLQTSGTNEDLQDVWGASPTDVFAVGSGVILHYDGSSWSAMDSGFSRELKDVYGTSASNVYAVGQFGKVLHYDGSSWSEMWMNTVDTLHGVWCLPDGESFAVGDGGMILHHKGG